MESGRSDDPRRMVVHSGRTRVASLESFARLDHRDTTNHRGFVGTVCTEVVFVTERPDMYSTGKAYTALTTQKPKNAEHDTSP